MNYQRCEYCGREDFITHRQCEGCGAPLPEPEELLDITSMGDARRRVITSRTGREVFVWDAVSGWGVPPTRKRSNFSD